MIVIIRKKKKKKKNMFETRSYFVLSSFNQLLIGITYVRLTILHS